MKIEEYPDRDLMAMNLADKLASQLERYLNQNDAVLLAVPGGTTPGPIFDVLSGVRLDWDRVRVVLTDERWVAEDHPRSNTGLVRDRLLTGHAAAAQYLPLHAPGPPAEEVPRLSAALEPHLPISVLLLGMGADLHIASLFPGAPGLAAALAADAPVLNILEPEGEPEIRVSLAAHVLDEAMSKHLVITGAEKRAALERAADLPTEQAPIRAVMSDLTVHWAE